MRYDPAQVNVGRVLAPPYDVISPDEQQALYARDLRNIVRVDFGQELPGDQPGVDDRYTRAAGHLASWRALGILRRDDRPAVYVHDHAFSSEQGPRRVRRGVFLRVPALPWEESEVLPHEHTMRGPKEDRLRLMRATQMQTSAIFAMWKHAPGMADALAAATARPPDAEAVSSGEVGPEEHTLWRVDEPDQVAAVVAALSPARLYIADGHHRYETAVAYARERRAAEPRAAAGADFAMTLLYLADADDPAMEVLPTHRLVRPGAGVPTSLADLAGRLPGYTLERTDALAHAAEAAARMRADRHAFAVASADGSGVLSRPRGEQASPRAGLDVTVLQDDVIGGACGIDPARLAEGALGYARRLEDAAAAVARGEAALALCPNGCTTAEIIAVSDAAEQMPQKSTYFYPKVPTGLVISPV